MRRINEARRQIAERSVQLALRLVLRNFREGGTLACSDYSESSIEGAKRSQPHSHMSAVASAEADTPTLTYPHTSSSPCHPWFSFRLRSAAARCLLAAAAIVLFAGGCWENDVKRQVIQNCGSDTMVNLAQMWAEEYLNVHPAVSLEISGGGSGVGIRDLGAGIIDIANSSRDITAGEKAQAKRNTGKEPVEWIAGYDGIAIYVHKDNPIESISIAQLAQIFGEGGTIDKWSQLGITMHNDEIVRVSRQNNSGTYVYFRDHVLKKKDFKMGSRDMSGSKDVVELIARAPGAIGYSGMGYKTDGVKFVKVAGKPGDTPTEPTIENVHKKSYPLARAMLMYTLGDPESHVKTYIDWVRSAQGQKIVEEAGFVPIPPEEQVGTKLETGNSKLELPATEKAETTQNQK